MSGTVSMALGSRMAANNSNTFNCGASARFELNKVQQEPIADYVCSMTTDTSSGLIIKKWASGFQEVWYRNSRSVAVTNVWYSSNMYYVDYTVGNWSDLGVTWAEAPVCIVDSTTPSGNCWVFGCSGVSTTSRGSVRYIRPTSGTYTAQEYWYYFGYWK